MKWFGTPPECWESKRARAVFNENTKINSDINTDVALQFRYGEIVRKKRPETIENLKRYTVVETNDIMVNGLNLNYDFVTQRVALVKEKGAITPAYISIRPRNAINPAFACYLLKAMDSQKVFNGMGAGIRLTLGYSEFKQTMLPIPPRKEQDQIVGFLDWKVSQINKLINAKKRQILLSQELWAKILNTKATEFNSNYKEIRLGNLGVFRKGFGGSRADDSADGFACIRYGDIYKTGVFKMNTPVSRIKQSVSTSYARVYKNEVLFPLSGETKEDIGMAMVNEIDEDTWCSGDCAIFTSNGTILPRYLTYAIRCSYLNKQRASMAKGDIIVHLSTGALQRLRILVPPIEIQESIVSSLDMVYTNIQKMKTKIEAEIDLFYEYRTRLISDVVTGKLDVSKVVIPEFELLDEVEEENEPTGTEEK